VVGEKYGFFSDYVTSSLIKIFRKFVLSIMAARFFLFDTYQNEKNIPNDYQRPKIISNDSKIF
jgi:hypothetical protein